MSGAAPFIGLTGAAGAGKDESAAVLRRAGWQVIAFADALRVEVAEAWAVPIAMLVVRADKDLPSRQLRVGYCSNASFLRWASYAGHSLHADRSPRWVMQQWGSFRRDQNRRYWVQHVERWAHHHRAHGARGMVVTDVRMVNEADMLRAMGGHLVLVHRPGVGALPADTAAHDSEGWRTLSTDAQIHNDGSLQHLQAEVLRVLQQISAPAARTESPDHG